MINPSEIGALVALVHQGREAEAERRTRALLESEPEAPMLWKILGVALVRQDKDALDALRKTAQLMPQDAEAHGNLGSALCAAGLWAEALPCLERTLELNPRDGGAMLDAAEALRTMGRPEEAVTMYRRALELDPRVPEVHNNLGGALLDMGRAEEAARHYRRAIELKADRPELHLNLGNALKALGQFAAALASYRRAAELQPKSLDTLEHLGHVLRDLGQPRDALAVYGRAVALDPTRPSGHCNLGHTLLELQRLDEAIASYNRALAIKPDDPAAHLGIGTVRRLQGQPAAAQASCAAALAIEPNSVEALSLFGDLLADRGRIVEANTVFMRSLALKRDFPFAYFNIAVHRKLTEADTAWLEGTLALLATRLPLRHEIMLRYALGKYLDDTAQYEMAFAQYRRANELTGCSTAPYDRAKHSERVGQQIARYDEESIAALRSRGSNSERPLFIVGMWRSGAALAEQILASHPAVVGAGELTYWQSVAADEVRRRAGSNTADRLPAIAESYLGRLDALSQGAARVVDKMPVNFLNLGLIHAAFPNARIIHMRRDPLDTCLSVYFQYRSHIHRYANAFANLGHYYREYLRITDHWRRVLPQTTLLEVPYEGLVADQERWSRRMLEFAGLSWDSRVLDFHRTERVVLTSSKWQVRQPIYGASAGRWRNYEPWIGPLKEALGDAPQRHAQLRP